MIAALVTIRETGPEDETSLQALWCAAWEKTYPAIDYRARWPSMWQSWRQSGAAIYAAMRGRDLIGMLVLLDKADGGLVLEQIALAPAEQGSGTAHLLMAFAKKRAPDRLRLTVNAFNRRAIHFYEREGFVRTGTGVNANSGLSTFDYEWRR